MAKVKVRTRSKTLYDSLRKSGLKKKKAAKVANSFDAYGRDEQTAQRREAGRRGGRATARKSTARQRAGRKGGQATARKSSARSSRRTSAPKRSTRKR
jgi:hypothetical protein